MLHEVKLIYLEEDMDANNQRDFTAAIDGVVMTGMIRFVSKRIQASPAHPYPHSYRFYFGKHNTITEHPDYRNIRRYLLSLMIKENEHFATAAQVLR